MRHCELDECGEWLDCDAFYEESDLVVFDKLWDKEVCGIWTPAGYCSLRAKNICLLWD